MNMKIFEYEHELQVLVYSVYTPWRLIVELEQSAHLHHASNRSSSSRWLSRTQLSDRLEMICSQRSIDVDDGHRRDGDSADRIDLPLARQRHTSREPPTQPPARALLVDSVHLPCTIVPAILIPYRWQEDNFGDR